MHGYTDIRIRKRLVEGGLIVHGYTDIRIRKRLVEGG